MWNTSTLTPNDTIITTNQTVASIYSSTVQPSISDEDGVWGPKRDALYIVIPLTIIYGAILVVGSIGNVSTCVVIARNKSMHTATNYYLFSLAVSDLLLLMAGLPYEMYALWYKYPYLFGEAFCVMQGLAAETSANATVLTITAFTIERYVAICHPFLSHTMSKLSRAVKYIIAIWLLALCLAIPQAMSVGLVYGPKADGGTDSTVCVCGVVETPLVPRAFELSSLICFLAPMLLISVLYALIAAQLHRARITGDNGNESSGHTMNNREY
ncbi:pyrokinin-1 receptor-like [Ctenocephalides felis]|uniref:pyrokinin-1 receptor-like n=1 Tax=Ctenocephalides felis TaxID=7515 RepID=UPI000E6E434B|nr:pyrokinin-1 receptor-like [Ctenocephalides felis]